MHIVWSKFLAGIQTYMLGILGIVGPTIVDYSTNFDWSQLGLSPNAVRIIGTVIFLVRMYDSMGEAPAVKAAKASDLTGSQVAGPNAANKG